MTTLRHALRIALFVLVTGACSALSAAMGGVFACIGMPEHLTTAQAAYVGIVVIAFGAAGLISGGAVSAILLSE